jgi:precorrin-6Y C5,15-methyltransferase (decarboxylating)
VITVVGIGAEGWASLSEQARAAVLAADLLVGGERQLDLLPPEAGGERRAWPRNLVALVDELPALVADGRSVAVLASGDPLLHGVGATILRRLGDDGVRVLPVVSSFALACARLRWPEADVELVSATSRVAEVVAPALAPGRRIVVLGFGPRSAAEVARVARERGFGASRLVVLEELGGEQERALESTAEDWGDADAAALHLVALEVRGDGPLLGRAPGLPDDAYEHDGQITKRDVRVVTLAALVPVPGQLLWDIGAGSGSVAIEWLRAAPGSHAIAIERDAQRAARIAHNALTLGVPSLRVVHGSAPEVLDELEQRPDAIFVGGGVSSYGLLLRCMGALAPAGRLVANVVTVEGEGILARAHEEHGGRLTRLSFAHAEPLGRFTGWRPAMPITQWELRVR